MLNLSQDSRRILLFNILIYFPNCISGRDCSISDGYIRGHWGNMTDICDQECGWRQCGDVCINAYEGFLCICGEEHLVLISGPYFCCMDNKISDNRTQCSVENGLGKCPEGRVVSKTEPCNNHCFNDYEASVVLGSQSHLRCSDTFCMRVQAMCLGDARCADSRDVSLCDEDLKCVLAPDISFKKNALVSDFSKGHYFCDYLPHHNDGQYHTITREDETDLNIQSNKVHINYTSITECNDSTEAGLPGLMCGETCLQHRWFFLGLYLSWCFLRFYF